MQINRTYQITKKKLFNNFLGKFIFLVGFLILLYLFGFRLEMFSNDNIFITLSVLWIPAFGIWIILFAAFVNYQYYLRDKDVTIFIDYLREEFQYIVGNKTEKTVKLNDILKIECYTKRNGSPPYYLIILKQDESIIVTSMLIDNMKKAFPNVRNRESLSDGYFILPKSVPNIIKGRFEHTK